MSLLLLLYKTCLDVCVCVCVCDFLVSGFVMVSASGADMCREWLPSASGARDTRTDLPGRVYCAAQCLAMLC